jgi:hypothetical protein
MCPPILLHQRVLLAGVTPWTGISYGGKCIFGYEAEAPLLEADGNRTGVAPPRPHPPALFSHRPPPNREKREKSKEQCCLCRTSGSPLSRPAGRRLGEEGLGE